MEAKYYWLKLPKDFFQRPEIILVERMESGAECVLFYLKLLLASMDSNGNLQFNEAIPYTTEMLASITSTAMPVVNSAIDIFSKLGLIELAGEAYHMNDIEKMVGSETKWAEKKRKYIENKKEKERTESGECPREVPSKSSAKKENVRQEIEIDKEIEIDSSIQQDPLPKQRRSRYGELSNVLLTSDEHAKLVKRFGEHETAQRIDRLSLYIPDSKKKYSNHYATILRWAERDKAEGVQTTPASSPSSGRIQNMWEMNK